MTTELKTGRSTAVIASEGAELKSLVIDGREIMWCGDPAYWGKTSPVLFPAIGNVRNNKTIKLQSKVNAVRITVFYGIVLVLKYERIAAFSDF